jgi:hypothetical protein
MKFIEIYFFCLLSTLSIYGSDTNIVGNIVNENGFTTAQRDFSAIQMNKNAKILKSDIIYCEHGKVHLKFGAMHVWMNGNSKLRHSNQNNNHAIELIEGHFLIEMKEVNEIAYAIQTNFLKIENLNSKTKLHIISKKNDNQIVSLKQKINIVHQDIEQRQFKTIPLKTDQMLKMQRYKNQTFIRNIEAIEKVYFQENLLLSSELKKTGPQNLDSMKPYLPKEQILSKSKKWLRKEKESRNLKQSQVSVFRGLLDLSSEITNENLNEAIQEDEAFTFPPPIDVPTSTQ